MKNIVLIGMPGAGKSTIGVILAKSLLFDFCDTDLSIQKETGEFPPHNMLPFRIREMISDFNDRLRKRRIRIQHLAFQIMDHLS